MPVNIVLPEPGADDNNWGVKNNAALTALEGGINDEEVARIAAVTDLQTQINNETLMD